MKIVRKSNYDKEGPDGDQYFVAENITNTYLAGIMCEALNEKGGDAHFYVVVADDYVLPPKWEP